MPRVARPNLIERRMSRFLREPPSVRTAAGVIVTATAVVVVVGGVLMRVFDHDEYSNVWVGMWWALQTVTTVGYGDVTPKNPSGRIIAAFVMLEGNRLPDHHHCGDHLHVRRACSRGAGGRRLRDRGCCRGPDRGSARWHRSAPRPARRDAPQIARPRGDAHPRVSNVTASPVPLPATGRASLFYPSAR
jgi:hypothetical protein